MLHLHMRTTLADIAKLLDVPVAAGADQVVITGLANLEQAKPGELSFLGSDRYRSAFASTAASAVVVQRKVNLPPNPKPIVLLVDDADLAMARVAEMFAPPVPRPAAGVHPTAVVSTTASLAAGAAIGPNVFVGDRTQIGRNVVLHPGVYVGSDVVLGDDCELFPNVVVRERITIGNRVIIHGGSVIGSDGFGYRWDGRKFAKVPQIGTVIIEDDVEIGSCTCVDRAKFNATVIGKGSKIDNLVQIAHNVKMGAHCLLAGQSGVAGSAEIGAGVVMGGQSAIKDHITVGSGVVVAATASVASDVEDGQAMYGGSPALPRRQWLREQAAMRRMPELLVQVRKLQDELEALRKQMENR